MSFIGMPLTSTLNKVFEALAVDMTGRNLQDKAKKAGMPWTASKGFDTFTPVGYVALP